MKKLLAIPALLLASHSFAECPATRPEAAPAIPSGASASREEMYEAQESIKSYVEAIEQYVECRKELHPLQQSRNVYLAETAAAAYNEELQVFRARENMIATN